MASARFLLQGVELPSENQGGRPAANLRASKKPDTLIASHQVFHSMYIMFSIMETIGDVPSILNVLVACPAARQAARQWPAMMIKAILNGLAKEYVKLL